MTTALPSNRWLKSLYLSPLGRILNLPRRFLYAVSYYLPKLRQIVTWTFRSREDTNFTYELTEENYRQMAHMLAIVVGCEHQMVMRYMDEARSDSVLSDQVIARTTESQYQAVSDASCRFGRRLGWYALVRLLKPRVVVETGVDKGLGAILLSAALLRNLEEGHPGRYYGTDINPSAGWLVGPPYDAMGEIIYGDSVRSLMEFGQPIDLFVGDSDHSDAYEYREYLAVADKLSDGAVVVSDNSHVTDALERFASETRRRFLFIHEVPRDHWYPGGGLGVAFRGVDAAGPGVSA